MSGSDDEATRQLDLGGLRGSRPEPDAPALPSFDIDGDAEIPSNDLTAVAEVLVVPDDELARTNELAALVTLPRATLDDERALASTTAEANALGRLTPPSTPAAHGADVTEELDESALESVRDLTASSEELPALIDSDEMETLDDEEELEGATLFRRPEPPTNLDPPTLLARPSNASSESPRSRAPAPAPPAAAVSRPPVASYEPPPDLRKPHAPAFAVDADDEEEGLANAEAWTALLGVYRARLVDADGAAEKALLWHKIGSVYEHALSRPDEAVGPLLEGFVLKPSDDALAASLERVALAAKRLADVASRAKREVDAAEHEARVALLAHLVFWYERHLGRAKDAAPLARELERLDKSHPLALRRAAQIAAANADVKAQRELLQRALDRATRPEEKTALALTLAAAAPSPADAQRHYELALGWDPSSMIALSALERLGRADERHGQVAWALERLAELARTPEERLATALRLADHYGTSMLDRRRAAEVLEATLEHAPTNANVLDALDRTYHALRDWSPLARILAARIEGERDAKKRAQLVERAVEVHEAKLGDLEGAAALLAQAAAADPKNRRALADLARIYERLGDWSGVATYKARLAELAPTPRQAAQLLVQLAEALAQPGRDPVAARQRLERALVLDPTFAPAWEVLQRVATEAGDEKRALACVRERAKLAQGPRQRAAVLLELGLLLEGRGEAREAITAFENAALADPSNEAAAARVITRFVEACRWKDAAPLSDLLVNAAVRDKDAVLHFERLRLATRIHAGVGDASKAMASALAALDLRPSDPGARADLLTVTAACQDTPHLLAKATPWLARLADDDAHMPADALLRLALLRRDGGQLEDAARLLERARKAAPDDTRVARELGDTYLASGDYARGCELKLEVARRAGRSDEAFKLLLEVGEVWAKRAKAPDDAALVLEEARRIRPADHGLLHTLMSLYSELGDWTALASVLEDITRVQESPEKKAKSLWAMAQVVRDKVGDAGRAVELLDALLDLDASRLDAFEELVRLLTEARDWSRLERSYRKMLARIKDDRATRNELRFALFTQLGIIYRDRLEDAERAYEALDAAARLRPADATARRMVTELLIVTDNLDAAVAKTRERIEVEPHDAELYADLYELFLRQHAFDKAWCAVNVLVRMQGGVTAEQAQFHADYAPQALGAVPGRVVEAAWGTHILHEDLDPTLTRLFAHMTPAVARMRHAQLRPDQLATAAGRPLTAKHTWMCDAIRAAFSEAAEILGLLTPELLVGDPQALVPFAPALAPYGAIYVSAPAAEASEESLGYLVGKRLAEQRPELAARAFFPSVPDLTALLSAAVRVSRRERASDAAAGALDANLLAVMAPEEREAVRAVVLHAEMSGARVDVKRWTRAADLSSMRAGLLLAGDVGPARKAILAEPQTPNDMSPREKLGELYKLAASDLYADLRVAVGVAVESG